MRVPKEIFDDVKKFMERRKQQYLAEQEGIQLDETELPHSTAYSLPEGTTREEMSAIIRNAIREELRGTEGISAETSSGIPPRTLTSQERVKQLLMSKPGEMLTTLEIGQILDMPNSTAREATRNIADEVKNVRKISGRPNKFIYEPDS